MIDFFSQSHNNTYWQEKQQTVYLQMLTGTAIKIKLSIMWTIMQNLLIYNFTLSQQIWRERIHGKLTDTHNKK